MLVDIQLAENDMEDVKELEEETFNTYYFYLTPLFI